MGSCRTLVLLALAALCLGTRLATAQPPVPRSPQSSAPSEQVKRIFLPPPLQWDNAMLSFHSALQQTATDFVNLTGGLAFGMSPDQANARLPDPYAGLSWNGLSTANEYPGEVRYFGVPIDKAGALRMGVTACPGAASYLVFLFNGNGLFRVSYRLTADKACPDTNEAAQQIFAHYVPLSQTVALSLRYRTGRTEVVDITDPTALNLASTRWRQSIN
jgi:hypothetical protein